MPSKKPNAEQLALNFNEASDEASSNESAHKTQPSTSSSADIEKPALSLEPNSLMEEVVDELNMEQAWAKVRSNRGAPGPDGITVEAFPAWFAPRWKQLKAQLPEGTYRPAPVRRKSIPAIVLERA